MIRKIIYIVFVIFSLLIIAFPILIYSQNFSSVGFSENTADWALFGDYLGGVLNPIISFLSLVILGFITYLVGKNSNEENKNLFLFKKRVEAYEELAKYLPGLNSTPEKMSRSLDWIKQEIIGKGVIATMDQEQVKEFCELSDFYSEFYYFLLNYNISYSIVFKYDFDSVEYKKLLELAFVNKEGIVQVRNVFENKSVDENAIDVMVDSYHVFENILTDFINSLRKEL